MHKIQLQLMQLLNLTHKQHTYKLMSEHKLILFWGIVLTSYIAKIRICILVQSFLAEIIIIIANFLVLTTNNILN